MNKKVLFIGGGALAIVAIVVALIFIFTGGSDEYRSIKVFEMDGKCTVTRGNDTLDAFKNMALSSGDTFEVPGTGFARLKLDDDKFVYLEAGTKIELFATGNEKDSKTRVFIERGSMMTEVKRKLSATSSYDIVTPNTTMSIRGTKTLTEVIEDAVTGQIKTSNAILEGQVKIKAIKVKADGTVVSVEKDLGAGEGNSFSSTKEELVSQEEMKSIADTGSTESGIKVEIVSEEEAEVVFDVAVFRESFMENIKEILIADAQAEAGEEGLSQEQIDSINDTLNLVMESFDTIQEVSQQAIYDAANGSSNDQPVYSDNGNQSDNDPSNAGDLADNDGSDADTGDADTTGTGDDTETVTGEESLIDADDLDTGDEDGDEVDGDDADAGNEDENPDEADETDKEDGSDEDDKEDESDETGENDDAGEEDESDDEDKSDDESDVKDKEDEDKDEEDNAEEESNPGPAPSPTPESTTDAGTETEAETENESGTETEPGTQTEQESEAGTEPGTQTEPQPTTSDDNTSSQQEQTTPTVTTLEYNNTTWKYDTNSWAMAFGSSADSLEEYVPIKLVFRTGASGASSSRVEVSSLPTTEFTSGNPLPGYSGSSYEPLLVPDDPEISPSSEIADSISERYSFTGWYSSQADAQSNNLSKRVLEYPADNAGNVKLWPGIAETVSVILQNPDKSNTGELVIPGTIPTSVVRYDINAEGDVVVILKKEASFVFPTVETHAEGESVDNLYIKSNSSVTSMYCYTRVMDGVDVDMDVAGLKLSGENTHNSTGTRYYPSETLVVDSDYTFKMRFTTLVELRIAQKTGDTLNVAEYLTSQTSPMSLSELMETSGSSHITGLPYDYDPGQSWQISSELRSGYTLYTLKTYYYGKELYMPQIGRSGAPVSGYARKFLSGYKSSSTGLVTNYIMYPDYDGYSTEYYDEHIKIDSHSLARDRSVYTAQLVDWARIQLYGGDVPTGVTNYIFKEGEHNPYVIPNGDGSSADFAISPIDLYTNANEQPTGAFYINPQQSQVQDHTLVKRYIYAPDDIIYPWYNSGTMRTGVSSDQPLSYYGATALGNDYTSFSYIGAQGYKLAGYEVYLTYQGQTGSNPKLFLFNEIIDGTWYQAFPCIDTANRSVTNKLSLDGVLPNVTELEGCLQNFGITMCPIFVQASPVSLSLSYEEDANSFYGSYTAKTSVVGNYKLNLSGIDLYTVERFGLDLTRFRIDTVDYQESGTVFREIGNKIIYEKDGQGNGTWKIDREQSADPARLLNSDEYTYDEATRALSIDLTSLYVNKGDSYNTDIAESGSTIFFRGLMDGEELGSNAGLYKADRFMKIADGESFKYSCFINKQNSDSRIFSRVFTANDVFSDSVDDNGDTVYGHIGGVIMDMAGTDGITEYSTTYSNACYGMAYYGGMIVPCSTTANYCVGGSSLISSENEVGAISSTVAINICQYDITRKDAEKCGTNISTFLGVGSNGRFTYAGIFEFKPYKFVKILDATTTYDNLYIYKAEQFDTQNNTYARRPSPWGEPGSYAWKNVNQAISSPDGFTPQKVSMYIDSSISEVPDGFVKVYWGGAESMIYTRTSSNETVASYNVSGKGQITDADAKDHVMTIQYLVE